jgi:hypothetical protein
VGIAGDSSRLGAFVLTRSNRIVVLRGSLERLTASRTFVDGQLFNELTILDRDSARQTLNQVFCTSRLLGLLGAPGPKEIYIWNKHIFAIRDASGLTDDIEGVRKSFLFRDRFLLLALAGSIVMLPYVVYVVLKKLSAIASLPKVRGGEIDA